MALVLPLDEPRAMEHRGRHNQLRLKRLCPRACKHAMLIDTNTIIRGGLLIPDRGSHSGEFFVIEDIWMRLKSTELVIQANI
jgi:hypothetical protein